MLSMNNNNDDGGTIQSHVDFVEAAANGSRTMVEFLLENGANINGAGKDGTTPLCAASLWGNENMVKLLLKHGADVNARNDGTGWTALHAASFQEHGKVVRILLDNNADPSLADNEDRSATDYASISEAIWPFFSAKGQVRSVKSDLIRKGIIRKLNDHPDHAPTNNNNAESISTFSRPGSAYIRVDHNPFQKNSNRGKSRDGRKQSLAEPIDPLSGGKEPTSNNRRPSLQGLAL